MGLWSSKPRAPVVVDDLDPVVEWKLQAGDDRDVVEIYLPGFKKEQVRVLVDDYGVLSAAGERPARGGTRWERFRKDIRLPDNCDVRGVRAEFVEKLVITLPIVPVPSSLESETTLPSPSSFSPPPPPATPRPPPVYPDEPPLPPLPPSPPAPPPYFKPPPPRRRSSRPPVMSYPLPPPRHPSPPPPLHHPPSPSSDYIRMKKRRYLDLDEPPSPRHRPPPSPPPPPPRHPLPPAPPPTYSDLSPSSAPLKPIAATLPATSQSSPPGTPADTTEPKQAALLERKISIASSPSPRDQEGEAPKKQLQDGKMPEEEDGDISKPSSSPVDDDKQKGKRMRVLKL